MWLRVAAAAAARAVSAGLDRWAICLVSAEPAAIMAPPAREKPPTALTAPMMELMEVSSMVLAAQPAADMAAGCIMPAIWQ